jgi:hypothetical protein
MQSHAVYKVPQGKLLKVSLEYNEQKNTITEVKIIEDFFAYPEEAVEVLEKKLVHTVLEREPLLNTIRTIIEEYHIEFIGLDVDGLIHGILMCRS